MGDLSRNFDRSEFACQCGCGFDRVEPDFITMLQQVRDALGVPVRVNSGCRCQQHNDDVGGVPHSAHMRGRAADIAVWDSEYRWQLVSHALEVGFKRIGIGKTFVHLDNDPFLPQPRMWEY